MTLPQEIIARKRDGGTLADAEIETFVRGLVDGGIGDAQAGAFAMAVLLNGMSLGERTTLTRAMANSGTVLDWSGRDLPGPILDKHSTGGVGDKVSLILAPILAACGACVPMISGRGLGHTGGTLDKLESIPGYNAFPDLAEFQDVVCSAGAAIIGATDDLAPADRRLYAIRDVTGTVESLDLITASILAKKLAAGLDGLVMDVKCGNGAFASTLDEALPLAESIVEVAFSAGLSVSALITNMDAVLGRTAGNAVEVAETVALLRDPAEADPRLSEVTLALAADALRLGRIEDDPDVARQRAHEALVSGHAAERFAGMVQALGGPPDFLDRSDAYLPVAPVIRPVFPDRPGAVRAVNTRAVGLAVVELGGGRRQPTDRVDHRVGLSAVTAPGQAVAPDGTPLAVIHAASEDAWERAARAVREAVTIGKPAKDAPLILKRVG